MDLCNGGMVWSCCVPTHLVEEVTPGLVTQSYHCAFLQSRIFENIAFFLQEQNQGMRQLT